MIWERQYEHARWNGLKLNILSTAFDGGKRLQVSEIPYSDLPHIKVMGTKTRTYTIEAVFVGSSSLADANALIENLEATPTGELEHPWLGELALPLQSLHRHPFVQKRRPT
ncbi:DNA circularization N-terminal domain-containing protein [Vibrio lentus]|uniref:DNA circularization N-terminal domain-containing protein n=1 Tax=Vibrio lentus TaxID=136468 RepID=UPI001F52EA3F|nr:DNA circularization N-terminal domain-containing protein [Vibrio lentus]